MSVWEGKQVKTAEQVLCPVKGDNLDFLPGGAGWLAALTFLPCFYLKTEGQ